MDKISILLNHVRKHRKTLDGSKQNSITNHRLPGMKLETHMLKLLQYGICFGVTDVILGCYDCPLYR